MLRSLLVIVLTISLLQANGQLKPSGGLLTEYNSGSIKAGGWVGVGFGSLWLVGPSVSVDLNDPSKNLFYGLFTYWQVYEFNRTTIAVSARTGMFNNDQLIVIPSFNASYRVTETLDIGAYIGLWSGNPTAGISLDLVANRGRFGQKKSRRRSR